jgi:hypothetical protein
LLLFRSTCLGFSTSEYDPTIEPFSPRAAPAARLDSQRIRGAGHNVAEADRFLRDESGEANADRPAWNLAGWLVVVARRIVLHGRTFRQDIDR